MFLPASTTHSGQKTFLYLWQENWESGGVAMAYGEVEIYCYIFENLFSDMDFFSSWRICTFLSLDYQWMHKVLPFIEKYLVDS